MMAKWFLNSFLTSIFIFAPFSVFAEKFSAAKHVKYHIRSRAEPNFTAHSLKKFPSDSNAKSHFVHENRLNFNSSRPTRIFVHGFYSDSGLMESYAKAYLNAGDFNFIAVDWLAGAKTLNYPKARHRVREVGEALAVFIDHLVGIGMNLEHLILVGHSLGAHVCGFAGKSVKSGKIPIIVGLDPALPLFSLKNKGHRLAYTDARYVQIIHTSGGFLGIKHAIGHADFYPNYGCKQPGCSGLSSEVCSHARVHDLFQESLRTPFWAQRCASFAEIKEHNCSKMGASIMGGEEENMERAFGLYYLETRENSPYAISSTSHGEDTNADE